jgi:hypothetical protein
MDREKIQEATKDLKVFFENKKVKISEAKEVMFRVMDYIDTHFDEDAREVPFKNGNTNLNLGIIQVPRKGVIFPSYPKKNSSKNSSLQKDSSLQKIIKKEPFALYNKIGGKKNGIRTRFN